MSDPLLSLPQEKVFHVSGRLFNSVIETLKDSKGLHLETALAGLGAMGGLYLLRATRLPIDSLMVGEVVLCDEVNELGPELVGFATGVASMMGFDGTTGWGSPVPPQHEPHKSVSELTRALEPVFYEVFVQENIDPILYSRFVVLTALQMLKQGEAILPEEVGKSILLNSIVAGSKTVPTPFRS